MHEPTVSVLLPVYNGSRFLRASIESVMQQSYSNYELIVVDDGSDDGTRDIIDAYGTDVVCIRQQSNQGISVALNRAMDVAKGEFILFQTSDDLSHKDRIRRQIDYLKINSFTLASCVPAVVDAAGEPKASGDMPVFTPKPGYFTSQELLRRLFFNGNFVCAPSVAFHKGVWSSVGAANAGLLQMQDFEYWLRAAMRGVSLYVDDAPLVSFRWHGRNLSSSANDARTRREMAMIYRNATEMMSGDDVRHLFQIALDRIASYREYARVEEMPKAILLPLLLVRHRLSAVRQIGYEGLLRILEDDAASDLMRSHTGMDRKTVMDLLLRGE